MPAPTPSSGTTSTATHKAAVNSSTKFMLTRMEQSLGKTHIPPTTPYFVSEIADNRNLKQVQEKITNLKEDRDSIFRVGAELGTLISSLEKSTLKPELKNLLLSRAKNLLGVIDQAIEIDARFSALEEGLGTLEAQRLKTKQEHYKAIETAVNPREKAAQLLQAEKMTQAKKSSQPTLKEYKDQVTQAIKLFQHLHKKIEEEYTYLRDSTPGNLGMKTFQALLSTPTTPSIEQQSITRMSGTKGG